MGSIFKLVYMLKRINFIILEILTACFFLYFYFQLHFISENYFSYLSPVHIRYCIYSIR